MGHSQEEERQLFALTLKFLYDIEYIPTKDDYEFLVAHHDRLVTPELTNWLINGNHDN
ncbi:MAG: hypothetical protein KW793_03595 [Candidatus Doudnabacteria bacterium]|nr:hypothetical protein [Candidatus Doudnabacteria bacterium]